jgi:hypothetical protein
VFFRRSPDVKARDVNELVAHTNVALLNEDTSVVNGLGQTLLVDLSLKTTLQELLRRELQDEIQLELIVGEETITAHSTKKGSTLKDALRILGIKRQESTSGLSKLGKSKLNTPNLPLASESVLSTQLELGIQTFLFERTTGRLVRLTIYMSKERFNRA